MECAARGRGSPCARGPPSRRCGLCGAVAYCSKAHQISHWNDHKEECPRLAEQMKNAEVLNDFPFTFLGSGKQETRCSILTLMGLHHIGIWKSECSCRPSAASSKSSWIIDNWDLPSSFCPCLEPGTTVSTCMSSWKDYYQWRCLPLHSPVALLLHWTGNLNLARKRNLSDASVLSHAKLLLLSALGESYEFSALCQDPPPLTVCHCFQVSCFQRLLSGDKKALHIHYLGPEKELLQIGVFGELRALFPGVQLHMEFVGPAVPQFRDGEVITFCNYLHCSEEGCCCKDSSPDSTPGVSDCRSSTVTVKLHKGFYHDVYEDIAKDSYPHLVVAPNAGIAAYPSWLPTIELLKEKGIPAIFTDFCGEAAHLAARCIGTVTRQPLRVPVQLNPFRQPLVIEDSALYLPCYSNCFLFGM